MGKMGKRYKENATKVSPEKKYTLDEALSILAAMKKAKFDETVDVAVRLGVDPKQADQNVRGSVRLPNGTGKSVRVLVIAKGEKEKEAKDAGADFTGAEDALEKIQKGWLDFDKIIATPDMMGAVGRLGQVLGPRGLMPNPKTGTVTFEVGKAVKETKAGKVDFRVDKAGIVHSILGKSSFGEGKIKENFSALMDSLMKAKPSTSKGTYIKSVTLSTTMGPAVKIDPSIFMAAA